MNKFSYFYFLFRFHESIILLRSMLFTLARHCNQSLKMSLWRPHWITLSPVSYFTSYSLSVMNKYSADIWLQLISKPWKIKRRMHRGGEMGIVCCCSVFQFFQLILQDTMSTHFELCLRNFLIDRREKEQTWETGPGRYGNSCAGRGKLRDIEFTKWRLVSCHPTGRHCTLWFCDFVFVECPRKSNVLSSIIVPFSRNEKKIAANWILFLFIFIVTNRKIKKIRNVHKFKKLSKVLTKELSNCNTSNLIDDCNSNDI